MASPKRSRASSTATARSSAPARTTARTVAQRYLHGLAQAEEATFAAMAAVVEDGCAQQFQHFISNSPWRHEPVVEQIGRDADRLLGGKPTSALIIDESSFAKQGDRSVGVARQWCGRLGKVDNCQVAVFAVLTDGERHTPVDMRLYLPQRWIDDPARCDQAEIPAEARTTAIQERTRARDRACGAGPRHAVRVGRRRCRLRQGARLPAGTGRHGRDVRRRCAWHAAGLDRAAGAARSRAAGHAWTSAEQATGLRDGITVEKLVAASARTTGPVASCATARAARCGSISRIGGSGSGMARKRRRGAGI